MKVILINGSPNEKGCTHAALCEVIKGLESGGVEGELLWIGKEPISPCTACRACGKTGSCVLGGDMVNETAERLRAADGLVIGSPVYFASPNGSLLAFLDRLFYSAAAGFAHKPAAAVVSARRAGTTASLDVLNKYFTICEMPVVSSRYWNMVHGSKAEDVALDAEGSYVMRRLGANMAWLIRAIAAGRELGIEPPEHDIKPRTSFIR